MWLCVCSHVHMSWVRVNIRRQSEGVGFLLPPYGFSDVELCSLGWPEAPLHADSRPIKSFKPQSFAIKVFSIGMHVWCSCMWYLCMHMCKFTWHVNVWRPEVSVALHFIYWSKSLNPELITTASLLGSFFCWLIPHLHLPGSEFQVGCHTHLVLHGFWGSEAPTIALQVLCHWTISLAPT